MRCRVSDYIVTYLESLGVKSSFMLSGGGMMHLIDALGRSSSIKIFCNHHEQASAIAAESYARMSGSLGVCYATSGPGGTNVLTGLVGAWQDSAPVLFLTGQSKVSETIQGSGIAGLRQFGTFEVDIVPMVKSVTKYSVFLSDPNSIRYHLEKAVYLALTGRPGPVLLDIPLNVQGALIEPDKLKAFDPKEEIPAGSALEKEQVMQVLLRLFQSERPLILAGHGIRCAGQAAMFRKVANALRIPLVTTQLGKDLLCYDDPLFIGHPGMKGDRPGNFAVQVADTILVLGSSLHAQTTGYELDRFAPNAYKIQVDPDAAILQRSKVGVAEKIQADLKDFLSLVDACLANDPSLGRPRKDWEPWLLRCAAWKESFSVRNEPHVLGSDSEPANAYEFVECLSQNLSGDELLVTDAGSAFYVIGQAFKIKGAQRVVISGAMGAMGYALPAATGAAAAAPDRTVICVTGDGSLQTNVHELGVHQHYGLNIKLFVLDNDGYVSIRNTQNRFFAGHLVGASRDSGVSLPNLARLAETYGYAYVSCDQRSDLNSAIQKTLATHGPVLCAIRAQPEQEIIPTVSSAKLDDGRMVSKPLEDMYPFWGRDQIEEVLKI